MNQVVEEHLMKNGMKNKNNFTDVLGMDVRYAVLTKRRRVQILVKPTPRQLRKRGKKGWHLFSTVDSSPDAGQFLNEALAQALADAERISEPSPTKKSKDRSARAEAVAVTE
jgi:hypothetical protein